MTINKTHETRLGTVNIGNSNTAELPHYNEEFVGRSVAERNLYQPHKLRGDEWFCRPGLRVAT